MPVPRITKEDLKRRLDEGSAPLLIDVRLKYPYEHSTVRLPGALRVSPHASDFSTLPRDRDVVAYDSDPHELVSSRVCAELIRRGYRASALKGGLPEWIGANFPIETKEAPRQVAPEPGSLKG